jgi:protein SCO1/2
VRKQRALQIYGREGAAEGWHFLTGDAETVRRLNQAIGFRAVRDEASGEFIHAATILLVTPEGRIARYLYGTEYAPKDLRLGLVEASQEKLGNPIDQVLLYCYRYDPATGKYTLMTMRLLRIGGALTVIGLATMILLFLRLEKRRPGSPSEGIA